MVKCRATLKKTLLAGLMCRAVACRGVSRGTNNAEVSVRDGKKRSAKKWKTCAAEDVAAKIFIIKMMMEVAHDNNGLKKLVFKSNKCVCQLI